MAFNSTGRSALLMWGVFSVFQLFGQSRKYAPSSVLSSGNWYRIGVTAPGVYSIDLSFLNKLGVNTGNLSSASLQVFGNGGGMLPESPGASVPDDLNEVALWVEDGGDGLFNDKDRFYFFAQGPDHWEKDSLRKTFRHVKNRYSDTAYYYLTIGSDGKRMASAAVSSGNAITVSAFDFRYFHELDTFNLLSSGKQWYGEEFSTLPGRTALRTFHMLFPAKPVGFAQLRVKAVGRSIGAASGFSAKAGATSLFQTSIPPVASGPYDLFAQTIQQEVSFDVPEKVVPLQFDFSPGSYGAQAWMDWFEVNARCPLSLKGQQQLFFRDWNSVGPGNKVRFTLTDATGTVRVWEVTDAARPVNMGVTRNGTDWQFVNDAGQLREYIAVSNEQFLVPVALGKLPNQNLHGMAAVQLLIVTAPALKAQAQRLADHHRRRDGITAVVATAGEIYNEFSSGIPDPVAVRDFVKMYYDRAGTDTLLRPQFLLLFGDASFDYKNRIRQNTSLVPAYESEQSLDPLATYVSDDFFAFLDDADDINGNVTPLLDLAVGRVPAASVAAAAAYVDKVIAYHAPESMGPWRNELSFVADDEDNNLHLDDAESISKSVLQNAPQFHQRKVYLDAYSQESGAGGSTYPSVNKLIRDELNSGNLIWNYGGHGGYKRLAEENILDREQIDALSNSGRLPLFITSTCDVAPYDNPLLASIGEYLLLRPATGAIALMTTTRLVFAYSNKVMNANYLSVAFKRNSTSQYPTLGESLMQAKNLTYRFFGDVVNSRKFTLLGDPALRIGFPYLNVETTTVNDREVTNGADTIGALSACKVNGTVTDADGRIRSDFNGNLYASVYEKAVKVRTKANDPGSSPVEFEQQDNLIFRGKARVEAGQFQFSFVVPRDIDYRTGRGRILFYAENGKLDGNGQYNELWVGGTGGTTQDKEGPSIKAWLNDQRFTDGSLTDAAPVLLMQLRDSSGINVLGKGIGHDLMAILDGDPKNSFVLNDHYSADAGDFRSGKVSFKLPAMAAGWHSLTIKAWDVANNSTETQLNFRVGQTEQLVVEHVLNYPNPFTTHTVFGFDHNRPGEALDVVVQVFTVTGKLVKTLKNTIISSGNRSYDVQWDGRDEYGARLARGVYIYQLKVRTNDGKHSEKWEKLFIL